MQYDYTNSYERLVALQVIDANVNRASEGLRVVEEYCRFLLADPLLTARCKALRDQLHAAIGPVSRAERLMARDTSNDVGTTLVEGETLPRHLNVVSLEQIAAKNGERVKEALRAIEEYCKTISPDVTRSIGLLRYEWYTLERDCHLHRQEERTLADSRLYVLIDGGESESALVEGVQSLIAAGVHIIQLRDKKLADRTLLARARLLRRVIDEAAQRVLFIMNDRPDLAVLARADGVHVGQEELRVRDVRGVVGSKMLVGVSTHNIEQAQQAVRDGADYIGCGPTFPSVTKHFEHFPGLDFLRQVSAAISLPAFAIGGITRENLPEVIAAGFTRAAVSSALSRLADPGPEAAAMLEILTAAATGHPQSAAGKAASDQA